MGLAIGSGQDARLADHGGWLGATGVADLATDSDGSGLEVPYHAIEREDDSDHDQQALVVDLHECESITLLKKSNLSTKCPG